MGRGDAIYENHLFTNDEHTRWAEDLSGLDEEQGMGDVHVLQQVKHLGRYMGAFMDHQTDVTLVQVQLSVRSNTLGDREMRGCHGDMVYDRCSYMNMVSGVNNDKLCRLPEKVVNERQTVCCTPSLTNITGNSPVSQRPTHSKMHNKNLYDPQTAIDPHHRESVSSSCTQQDGGTGNRRHLNLNVKRKKRLTRLSVKVQEWSTVTYSLGRKPKVLDKHARCVDNKYNPKVIYFFSYIQPMG
jgi:hypothetical protein